MYLDQQFIRSVIPDVSFLGIEIPPLAEFSVDSRLIKRGEIFVAIKGTRADGHDFIHDAVRNGASGLVIAHSRQDDLKKVEAHRVKNIAVIMVSDPEAAIIALARAWRTQFSFPVIGITGSVGKTSTKELLANILRIQNKRFLVSHDNQNTALGVSLNILKMRPEHEVAIFEMGINKRGEMARMAELVRPTSAIITAVGHSHMEGLGSLNDISAEKRDIFKFFKEDSIGIVNGDLPILATIAYAHPIIKFGSKTINQIQARKIQVSGNKTQFVLKLYHDRYKIVLDTQHVGRVFNALAAVSVAHYLNISHDIIIKGIQSPCIVKGRFQSLDLKASKGIIINDCYNASPESMKAALLAFEKIESKGPKIAVLGDMLELGVNSPFWHRQLGRLLRKVPSLKHVVLVGEHVKWTLKTIPVGMTVEMVPTWREAIKSLELKLDRESVVLVKGSRGVGLDNLITQVSLNTL